MTAHSILHEPNCAQNNGAAPDPAIAQSTQQDMTVSNAPSKKTSVSLSHHCVSLYSIANIQFDRQNLCFILNKPHHVEFAERPIPTISTAHQVLVAVNYTGICGSDVHYWEHGRIGHFVVKDPMVLGHESAGTVVEVGSAVNSLKPGDRVALEPGYPCRQCIDCLAGRYNLCPEMVFAATPPYDGTLTGFWVAPFDFCYKLPDNVSTQEGALIEPLAVAVHIVKQAQVAPGNSVVIMGAGPVGLLCAAVAKSFGATKIVSVDIVQAKLDFARQLASTHTYISQRISPEDNAKALIEQCDLDKGADVVIDASGAESSIQTSLHTVKMGGTYVQGGMGKADISFPIMAMCQKEVTARGSFRYGPGDYKLAIELVANGSVNVGKLISGVVDFAQAEDAFKKVKEGQVIKVIIAGPNEPAQEGFGSITNGKVTTNGTDTLGGCC
ncbi:putative D-xylulose reductase A [Neonectria ditissima]|uniref:L-arabinitol 4-dehydrogenase n=1 Tax=Neonectria ditissima TaxID=78410 RepID=A0A0P7BAU1_9HYPO|nr:putative D-xylulose reductase A [Neonectria ditissima]